MSPFRKILIDFSITKGIHYLEFLAVSISLTPVTKFIAKYLFSDKEFIISLAILIAVDTALAVLYHLMRKSISSEGFSKFFLKIIIYGAFLIIIHTAINLRREDGSPIGLLSWLDYLGYTAIVVREIISIIEKANKLRPGLLPPWILKRFKDFDDTGKFNDNTTQADQANV